MTPLEWIGAGGALAAGALLQGAVGFGSMLVATPLLILLDPALVPGPAITASLLLTSWIMVRDRRALDLHGLRWAFVGALPGVVGGSLAVRLIPQDGLGVTFGLLVLAAVGLSASGWHPRPTVPIVASAGLLSGFMGTTAAIGGPPVALVYQGAEGPRIRGTLNGYFLLLSPLSLVALSAVGEYGSTEALRGIALMPGIAVGVAASRWLTGHVDRGRARTAVLVVAAASGIAVLVRALL